MTPTQQAALQAVYTAHGGGTFTAQQVTDITALVDARNDAGVAAYLSPGLVTMGLIASSTLLWWLQANKMRSVLEDAAHLSGSTYYATRRDQALAMLDLLTNKTDLDVSGSQIGKANVASLNAWATPIQPETVAPLTMTQVSALLALGEQPNPISYQEISAALNAPGV